MCRGENPSSAEPHTTTRHARNQRGTRHATMHHRHIPAVWHRHALCMPGLEEHGHGGARHTRHGATAHHVGRGLEVTARVHLRCLADLKQKVVARHTPGQPVRVCICNEHKM